MISQRLFRAIALYLRGFSACQRNHQAESILTCARSIRPSIVNAVHGYSEVYRFADNKRAHAALAAAQRKDPTNKYVQNNLRLLEESCRKGKSIE